MQAHRVHKAHSTRDVFYRDGANGGDHYSSFQRRPEPFVEFPPTLDRRSEQWRTESPLAAHRRHAFDEYSAGGASGRALQKSRSYADWEEGSRGPFGHSMNRFGAKSSDYGKRIRNRYDDDMARLEHEFRDARLMRIPVGNMNEKEQYQREIPGGYEAYSRETKAHSDRKPDGDAAMRPPPSPPPAEFRRVSEG